MALQRERPCAADRLAGAWRKSADPSDYRIGFAGGFLFSGVGVVVRRSAWGGVGRAIHALREGDAAGVCDLRAARSPLPIPSVRLVLHDIPWRVCPRAKDAEPRAARCVSVRN